MLDKILIRQKNIIFFKTIVYIVLISFMSVLLLLAQEELTQSINEHKEVKTLLEETSSNIHTITHFEKEIIKTKKRYDRLVKNADQSTCSTYAKFNKKINSASRKQQLLEPIKVEIARKFDPTTPKTMNKNIRMDSYNVSLDFNSKNTKALLLLLQEISQLLPVGSVIHDINIQTTTPLTPRIINKLNQDTSPGLINTQMQIEFKEVAYER